MNDYKVVATMEGGVPLPKGMVRFAYFCIVFFSLPLIISLIALIALAAGANIDREGVVACFFVFLFTAALMYMLFGYILKKNNNIKKLINLWLTDEGIIKTSAHAIEIDSYAYNSFMKESKILLRFFIDDVLYERESASKEPFRPQGYSRIYSKYANKVIDILFSPKYNKILLLESKKGNRRGKNEKR